jgi:hypothetical protein
LRGWLGYLRLQGLVEVDLAPAIVLPRVAYSSAPPRVFDRATVERLLGAVDRSTSTAAHPVRRGRSFSVT